VNYSKWLKITFPQLENESRVKISNYATKAKKDTRKSRWGIFLIILLIVFIISYVESKFTDFGPNVFMVALGIKVVISLYILNRIERRIIQNKLVELVGGNA
jgi:uncharacterized membrane protein